MRMYGQCEFWNELKNKCQLQKLLDAYGIEPMVPVVRPPQIHIDGFCKTKQYVDCWKIVAVRQMLEDSIFDEDFVPYVSVKRVLFKWLKWGVIISVVGFVVFIMIILFIYFTGGGMHFFDI
jgi:hypothetical protein